MAIESVSITPGSGKDIAVDTVSAVEFQVIKIALGADGAMDTLVDSGQQTMANSLPVVLASDQASVPVAATLQAGSAAVGKLAANSGVDIGDVDVTSIAAGTNNIGDVDIETFEPSADVTLQNAATGTGNGTVLTTTGYGTAIIQVTGTFVATITFEGTADGSNYQSISATQIGTSTIATTATTTGIFRLSVSGITSIRARISAYTSGSVTAIGRTTNAPFGPKVVAISGTVTVGSHAVTNAGTFATQIDGSALTALQLIDDSIFADDAAFTIGTSKVNVSGMACVAHGSNPDAADALDAVVPIANRHRIPFHLGGHPNIITIEVATTGAQTDAAIVTISTGAKIVVTQIQAITDNANTAFPQLRVGFGTANTPTTTGVVLTHPGLPAGGGVSRGDGSGILGIGADNEDLRYTCGAPTGGSLRILCSYFTIES